MKLSATVLCENSVYFMRGVLAESGWGIHLASDQGNFLFDTGQGLSVVQNARVMGVDLTKLDGIILSHHHYDHTGGLACVLERTGPLKVYAHPDIFKKSLIFKNGGYRIISMPFTREELEKKGADFVFNREFSRIVPGLSLTGEIPRRTHFEHGDPNQVVPVEAGYEPDPLSDDQSLVIETPKGLLVVLGCCHAGIINTLTYIREKTGVPINTVIGGTHLGPLDPASQEQSLAALRTIEFERLGVSHCTGFSMASRLAEEYGERFFNCSVGTVVEF